MKMAFIDDAVDKSLAGSDILLLGFDVTEMRTVNAELTNITSADKYP